MDKRLFQKLPALKVFVIFIKLILLVIREYQDKILQKKSLLTSPILAAYETFQMDFDLGKKYGRLLRKR